MNAAKPAPVFPRAAALDLLAITFLWSLAVAVVRPIGDFPLNDDWAMSMTAKRLSEGAGYHPSGWTEMTLIAHALWGALFCIPRGFSFNALRLSTLTLSLAGALGMYGLIRQLQRPRLLAVICALTVAFNPIYFALSSTFMTDVPFTALAIFSAWFFVRHLQKGSDADLLIGTVLAVAATLSRQVGLCLPLAFGITLWLKQGFKAGGMVRSVLPLIVCITVLVAFYHWLKITGRLPAFNIMQKRLSGSLASPKTIPLNVVYFGWNMLMYLGWFLLPLALPPLLSRRGGQPGPPRCFQAQAALLLFLVASVARFVFVPSLMPVHNNVIVPQGIGPETLLDTHVMHLPHLPALPKVFWLVVTALSLVGAALLVFKTMRVIVGLLPRLRPGLADNDALAGTFFLLCAGAYLTPFLLSGFFDRYLVPVTAFLAAFIAVLLEGPSFKLAPAQRLATILLLAGSGIFAVAGTRDYLEWNRTRWRALQDLLAQNEVKPKDVDGGFEFNAWHSLDGSGQSDWWAIKGTYVVAFGEIRGYESVRSYSYRNWMPPREGKILVLKRKDAD
jgi:4-amino-4-deoxy-L-arabinose transferase-like glycosyltransferase